MKIQEKERGREEERASKRSLMKSDPGGNEMLENRDGEENNVSDSISS